MLASSGLYGQLTLREITRKVLFENHTDDIPIDPELLDLDNNLSRGVPAFSYLRNGLRRLIVTLTFHYSNFRLSKHDSLRIKEVFQQLLDEGRIIKAPSRTVQWIGAILVRRLITTILQEAFEQGTANQDITIQKVLSILLILALSCRVGDITTAAEDDQPLPFLYYNDITIKLVGGNKLKNL